MATVTLNSQPSVQNCVPPDPFWQADRRLAEFLWQRGDGATVSTRVAEAANMATGAPVRKAKTNFHVVVAALVGAGTFYLACRVTDEPTLRLLGMAGALGAARKTFQYLQQDRCP